MRAKPILLAALTFYLWEPAQAVWSQQNPSSQNEERLREYLRRFPEADANQDGQLSASEVRDHRQQLRRRELEGSGPPESKFNFPVQFTWATMSDGVKIAIAVGFPKGFDGNDGQDSRKWPAILRMSGYQGASIPDPPFAYDNHYVMVRASVRGTGASGGRLQPVGPQNAKDGYEIIEEWIVKQPWSNGRVGIVGSSWDGMTGFLIACQAPPSLRAVAVSGLADDLYRSMCRIGGVRNSGFMVDWSNRMYQEAGGPFGADSLARKVRGMTVGEFESILAARPERDLGEDQLWTLLDEPEYTAAWQQMSAIEVAGNIRAPIHIMHAYQDEQSGPGGLWLWKAVSDAVPKRLLLSNGKHNLWPRFIADRKAWLDHWLRAESSGDIADPLRRVRIHFETTGSGEEPVQRNPPYVSSDFPLPQTQWMHYYFSDGNRLSLESPSSEQLRKSNTDNAYRVVVGADDDEIDRVQFSMRFDEITAIAGPVLLTLWAELTTLDTDFFVLLGDQGPDGPLYCLQRGMLRASHRELDIRKSLWTETDGDTILIRPHHPHVHPRPIAPGEPHRFDIEIFPVGHVFRPGHKLVVRLSQPPLVDPVGLNPDGTPSYTYEAAQPPGTVTILMDEDHPSRILVPLLPDVPPIAQDPPTLTSLIGVHAAK